MTAHPYRAIWFFVLMATTALMSCQKSTGVSGDEVAVRVGEYSIKVSELKRTLGRLANESEVRVDNMKTLMDLFLDRIVDHYLVLEYGRQNQISITDEECEAAVQAVTKDYPEDEFRKILLRGYIDFEDWKNTVREQILIKKIIVLISSNIDKPTPDEIEAYYETHQSEFQQSRQVRFRQVVLRKRGEADEIKRRLSQGEDFGELAKIHSIAPEAKVGGEVGWVVQGDLETAMEKKLFTLPPGQISDVIMTPYGYHIFEVLESRPAGLRSLSDAVDDIRSSLFHDKRRQYLDQWLEELRRTTRVKINEAVLETITVE